jgi:hypothetical protein
MNKKMKLKQLKLNSKALRILYFSKANCSMYNLIAENPLRIKILQLIPYLQTNRLLKD